MATETTKIKFVRSRNAHVEVFAGRKKIGEIVSSQSDGIVSWEAEWAGAYEARDAHSFESAECAIRNFVECTFIGTDTTC